jgi:TPR repeat protein
MMDKMTTYDKISNVFSSTEHLDFEMKLPYLPKEIQELTGSRNIKNYFMIGYIFDTGILEKNFQPDTEQAIFWYTKAANLGHMIAKLNLGVLYETGHQGNIQRDYHTAVNWYCSAIAAGHKGSLFNLGRLIWRGRGIAQSYPQACRLFHMAAKEGHTMAMTNIGSIYISGNCILAIKWLSMAATRGCCLAHHNLGIMYENGWGVDKDIEQANYHFNFAVTGNKNPISNEMSIQLRNTRDNLLYI